MRCNKPRGLKPPIHLSMCNLQISFIKAAKKAAGGGSLIGKLKGRKSSGGGAGGGGGDAEELEANGDSPLANGAAVRFNTLHRSVCIV